MKPYRKLEANQGISNIFYLLKSRFLCVIIISVIHLLNVKDETKMGKSAYLKLDPKQKCPKDHDVLCDGINFYYISTENKKTPTIKKIRNLLIFSLEADGDPNRVDPEDLAYEISLSIFRRLLVIMREYYGICSEDRNTRLTRQIGGRRRKKKVLH